MADRTSLKVAEHNDISNDDPFAELTRIMGFDPRQPVAPRQAAAVDDHASDFGIDLEKELLGELDAMDASQAGHTVPLVPANATEQADDLGDEMFGHFEAAALEDVAGEARAEPDFGEIDLDHAIAASLAAEWAPAVEAVADSAEDHSDEAVPVAAQDGVDVQEFYAPPQADGFDEMFDAALADFDIDVADKSLPVDVPAFEASEDAQAPEAVDAAEHDAFADLDIGDFDVAAETVREDAGFDEPSPAQDLDYAVADGFSDIEAPAVEGEAFEPVVHEAAFDDHFEVNLDDVLDDEEPVHAMTAQVPDIEPMPVAKSPAPSVRAESSLEDELNALMSRMSARSAVTAQPYAESASAVEPSVDMPAVDEAGWELELAEAISPAPEPVVHSPAAATGPALDGAFEAESDGVSAQDIEFDEAAFEAAFAKGIDLDEEVAPAAPPQAERGGSWFGAGAAVAAAAVGLGGWGRATHAAQPRESAVAQPQTMSSETVSSVEEPGTTVDYAAKYAIADDVPELDTVDVPERVVALPDDLDIPDLDLTQDVPPAHAYDDLDAEFANFTTGPVSVGDRSYADDAYGDDFGAAKANAPAYYDYHGSEDTDQAAYDEAMARDLAGFESEDIAAGQAVSLASDELDFDPDLQETMAGAMGGAAERPRGRGLMVAAIVGAVAVAGGLGAFALSLGGGGSDAPVLVKADDTPIKVRPENPGGTVIPNQENKVYETVAKGQKPAGTAAPSQEKLVTTDEEPMDVAAAEPESRVVDLTPGVAGDDTAQAPQAKAEDRIEQSLQDGGDAAQETVAVAPRKVRTMVVKPDGTLAPREDPAPAADVAATEPADPAPQRVVSTDAVVPEATGAVAEAPAPAAEQPVASVAKTQSATTPAKAPIAPQRPAEQPVDIVGEVKPDQVASIDPSTAATAGGSWSMQIASQPTVEAAQSTYQDLARRYSGVLNGHTANIVKAEIAGKGTFYRVRVPAGSRNDAIKLCESYKAAGGNCFVSK